MNNPLTQVATMARTLFKTQHSTARSNVLHPERDWYIGIGIGCIICTSIAAWSAYTYFENRVTNTVDNVVIEAAPPTYNEALITQAQQVIVDRATAFSAITSPAGRTIVPETSPESATTSVPVATSTDITPDNIPPAEQSTSTPEVVEVVAEVEDQPSAPPAQEPASVTDETDSTEASPEDTTPVLSN